MPETDTGNKVFLKRVIIIIFGVLVIVTGVLIFYVSRKKPLNPKKDQKSVTQQQKDNTDLYIGSNIEREQKVLSRGRFVKIDNGTLFLDYYQAGSPQKQIDFHLPDSIYINCEERYFVTSDGTKIDKLNAAIDTNNYKGEKISGGLGLDWLINNAKKGEAVEVRFLGDGTDRIPSQVLLYKDTCS